MSNKEVDTDFVMSISPLLAQEAKNERLTSERNVWRAMAVLFMISTLALSLLLIGAVYVSG